jgi:hypothetical protein
MSVDGYVVAGLPSNKLLLGLPYYGVEWQTYDLKFPSKAKKFVKYHTYRKVKDITQNYSCVIDEPSLSKYYTFRDAKNNYKQIWFDDSTTLGLKYDWIKEKKIKGIGIWALGYDNGHDELWKLIAKKFAYSDAQLAKLHKKRRSLSLRRTMSLIFRIIKNPRSLLSRPRPILTLFGSLFGFSLVGFYFIYRYGYRIGRVFKIAMKGTFLVFLIIAIALIFILFKYVKIEEAYYLIGGIILGLILFYFLSRRIISEKDLP